MTDHKGTHYKGMVLVRGGTFAMGSDAFYPEESPVREVTVDDVWVDEHPVTNAQFRRFVKDTGHVTVAERAPDPADFPGADPALLVAGSQVFTPTPGPVPLNDWTRWWRWQPGADWRHPEGPGSTLHGRELHPVVIPSSTSGGRTPWPTRSGAARSCRPKPSGSMRHEADWGGDVPVG